MSDVTACCLTGRTSRRTSQLHHPTELLPRHGCGLAEVARVVAVVATRGLGDVAATLELGAHDRLLYVVVAGVLDARWGSLAARRRNGPSPSGPRDEPSSDFWWTARGEASSYRGEVSRARAFLTSHGLDLLIVVTAAVTLGGTLLRDDLEHPSGPLFVLGVVGITASVLVLLARRRFPFAAPAATWLVCAALSFIDGQLIVNGAGILIAGMGAAVLLGSVRNATLARLGLVIAMASAATVVRNGPGSTTDDYISVPVMFALGWLVGWALRERTERTEAAEERARLAEVEREAAARVAVAEERGRIARELHDVVAHAVSVIVLQVGAVRHRMPESAAADRDALRDVEEAGRTALTEMRRLLAAMRDDDAALDPLSEVFAGTALVMV